MEPPGLEPALPRDVSITGGDSTLWTTMLASLISEKDHVPWPRADSPCPGRGRERGCMGPWVEKRGHAGLERERSMKEAEQQASKSHRWPITQALGQQRPPWTAGPPQAWGVAQLCWGTSAWPRAGPLCWTSPSPQPTVESHEPLAPGGWSPVAGLHAGTRRRLAGGPGSLAVMGWLPEQDIPQSTRTGHRRPQSHAFISTHRRPRGSPRTGTMPTEDPQV